MVVVMTVPVVHEKVHERAREQKQVRQRAEDVSFMLVPENEHCDRAEQAGANPKQLEGGRFGGHAFGLSSCRAKAHSHGMRRFPSVVALADAILAASAVTSPPLREGAVAARWARLSTFLNNGLPRSDGTVS